MNRIFLILIIVVVVVGLFVGGYYIRQALNHPKNQPTDNSGNLPDNPDLSFPINNSTTTSGGGTVPGNLANKRFDLVSQNPVYDFSMQGGGKVMIIQPDGQIMESRAVKADAISGTAISNLLRAGFSYDGTRIIASFGDTENPQVSVFDIQNKTWQPLAANFKEFSWSPIENKVAYLTNGKDGSVILSSLELGISRAKPVELLRLRAQDLTIEWVSANKIILGGKPSSLVENLLLSFDAQKKTLAPLLGQKKGLEMRWSNDGSVGLRLSVDSRELASLELVSASGSVLHQLNFLTRVDKCVFSSRLTADSTRKTTTTKATVGNTKTYLDCAVPRNFQALSARQLIDDYGKGALFTSDNIYEIDLESGKSTVLFNDSLKDIDVSNLKVFGNKLFFVNRLDQKLYSVSLE